MRSRATPQSRGAWILTLAMLAALCALSDSAPAGELITVRTIDGREFVAQIDGRTDASRLWVRFEEPGSVVLRSWSWAKIAGGSRNGQSLDRIALERVAAELKDTANTEVFPTSGLETSRSRNAPQMIDRGLPIATQPFAEGVPLDLNPLMPVIDLPLLPPGTIKQIRVDAEVCNWDADVEVDGLLLSLGALDAWGRSWPVPGSLQATLTARQVYGNKLGSAFPTIGRWQRTVRAEDYGADGAWLRLEFQGVHPEWAHTLSSSGLLQVRFTAPGHGTFEASVSNVRIRPFSAFRDRLQQRTKSRFLPGEQTAR